MTEDRDDTVLQLTAAAAGWVAVFVSLKPAEPPLWTEPVACWALVERWERTRRGAVVGGQYRTIDPVCSMDLGMVPVTEDAYDQYLGVCAPGEDPQAVWGPMADERRRMAAGEQGA